MKLFSMTLASSLIAGVAFADGHADVEAGGVAFNKQCVACHVVVDADGETLAGRKAKAGPNLYGTAGRVAGTVEGFRYGKSIVEAGEGGLVWNEETFVAYVQDPTGYLKEVLDNNRARGKMAFKVRKEQDAVNLYAFLESLAPAE